jgi:hypothetical protein
VIRGMVAEARSVVQNWENNFNRRARRERRG